MKSSHTCIEFIAGAIANAALQTMLCIKLQREIVRNARLSACARDRRRDDHRVRNAARARTAERPRRDKTDKTPRTTSPRRSPFPTPCAPRSRRAASRPRASPRGRDRSLRACINIVRDIVSHASSESARSRVETSKRRSSWERSGRDARSRRATHRSRESARREEKRPRDACARRGAGERRGRRTSRSIFRDEL